MTLPFRSRRNQRRPVFDGDPGDTDVTLLFRPPEWDGSTYEFGGASVAGLPDWQHSRLTPAPPALPAPRRFTAPVTVVSVTVGDGPRDGSRAAACVHATLTFLRFKVAIMEAAGRARRIDEAEHARRRGDEIAPRSAVGEIRREAAALLLGAGAP